jgi:hypothetical protein
MIQTGFAEQFYVAKIAKMSSWDQQTEGKNLVWFGEIERKLAKLSMTAFTYSSSSQLFYKGTLYISCTYTVCVFDSLSI